MKIKMKMNNIGNKFNLFVLIMFFICNHLFSSTGKSGFIILRRTQSSKPKSLTTVGAVRGDLSGIFYNPAIISTLKGNEIFFMAETGLIEDVRQAGLIWGTGFKNFGISVGVVNFDAGEEELYSYTPGYGITKRTLSLQNDTMFIFNYGGIIKNILIGGNIKYVHSRMVETKTNSAVVTDLSLMSWIGKLNYTFSIQNLGISEKFLTDAETLPTTLMLGFLTNVGNFYGGINFDYLFPENRFLSQVGLEYKFFRFISIACAYQHGVTDGNVIAGLYLTFPRFDLGYSFTFHRVLLPVHRLTLGIRF